MVVSKVSLFSLDPTTAEKSSSFCFVYSKLREMPLKSFVREIGSMSKKSSEGGKHELRRGRAYIAPDSSSSSSSSSSSPSLSTSAGSLTPLMEHGEWANLPPELLLDIIQKVEARETCWPGRGNLVSFASVCRSWREITKEVVKTPEQCGFLTFPISLKQPGPRDTPIQCFIRRERATSAYRLLMGLSPALSGDLNKLLLVAKKVRRATCTDFVISLVDNDFSRSSNNYVGKLRSNFLGNKFNILDVQSPDDSRVQAGCQSRRRTQPMSNYKTATISYKLNVIRTRGPRRMQCTMHSIPISAIEEGGTAPTPMAFTNCHSEGKGHKLSSTQLPMVYL